MKEGYPKGRLLSSFLSLFRRGRFLRSWDPTAELDYLHLEKIRNRLERSDRGLSLACAGPDRYPGSLPGDCGRRADSVLTKCLVAVRKDLDDLMKAGHAEDL